MEKSITRHEILQHIKIYAILQKIQSAGRIVHHIAIRDAKGVGDGNRLFA